MSPVRNKSGEGLQKDSLVPSRCLVLYLDTKRAGLQERKDQKEAMGK